MNIPKSITVRGITYTIELVDYIPTDEGHRWGECDYEQTIIKIWDKLSQEKQEQTFIHELTHAIAHEAGIEEQDEDVVNQFALVAYMVIKQFCEKEEETEVHYYS